MNIYHFASNTLSDIEKIFITELSALYTTDELKSLLSVILKHLDVKQIYTPNIRLNQSDLIFISECIDKLKQHTPIDYILGYKYFYHLKFKVNPHVLIPRPETEELVFRLKELIIKKFSRQNLSMLDVGTGSGCIAIALKNLFPSAEITAIDISKQAVKVAQENAVLNQLKVTFLHHSIFEDLEHKHFDVIVSNPPYIPQSEAEKISDTVKNHEPHIALFSDTPEQFYNRLFELSAKNLNQNGILFTELNQYHAQDIKEYAIKTKIFSHIEIVKDWSSNERFLFCIKQ